MIYFRQLKIIGMIVLFTNLAIAEKKFAPIIMDDMLVMVPIVPSNNLIIKDFPDPWYIFGNENITLQLQCEDDIAYFIASTTTDRTLNVSVNGGVLLIDNKRTFSDAMYSSFNLDGDYYIAGYIEGNASIAITAEVLYDDYLIKRIVKTCRSKINIQNNHLKVPTFSGNSQGKLVVQCEKEVVYYIMAYDCLRSATRPFVSADNGKTAVSYENRHVGEIFYVKGYVERTDDSPLTITGRVKGVSSSVDGFSWHETCQ